jgi:TonB family protein
MKTLFAVAIAFIWLAGQPLAPCADEATEESHFRPAEPVSFSDVTIPPLSVANGTVVLDVMISEEGEVRNVQVRRDIASETEEAVRSVRTWKFSPARFNGKEVASRTTIAVTFIPTPPLCANVPLPPLIRQDDEARLRSTFQPPDVTYATFPSCSYMALGPVTVTVEASLNEAGEVQHAKVLHGSPSFNAMAIRAIEDWKFVPATLNGRPVESKVLLVFCFRQPLTIPNDSK